MRIEKYSFNVIMIVRIIINLLFYVSIGISFLNNSKFNDEISLIQALGVFITSLIILLSLAASCESIYRHIDPYTKEFVVKFRLAFVMKILLVILNYLMLTSWQDINAKYFWIAYMIFFGISLYFYSFIFKQYYSFDLAYKEKLKNDYKIEIDMERKERLNQIIKKAYYLFIYCVACGSVFDMILKYGIISMIFLICNVFVIKLILMDGLVFKYKRKSKKIIILYTILSSMGIILCFVLALSRDTIALFGYLSNDELFLIYILFQYPCFNFFTKIYIELRRCNIRMID